MNRIAGSAAPQGRLAAAIVAAMVDTILILDPMGRILFLSTSNDDVLGHEPEFWIGQSALDLVHADDQEVVSARLRSALDRPEAPRRFVQVRICGGDTCWFPVEAHGFSPIEFEGAPCVLVSIRDTTGQLTLDRARRVADATVTTPTADLPANRQMIIDQFLPDMLRGTGSPQLLIICVSVRNHAGLVAEFGPTRFEELMAQLASGLDAQSRIDDLVARLSEHELIVACPAIETTRQASELAERIRRCAEVVTAELIPLELQVGFAFTSHGDDLSAVLEFAASAH